MLRVLPLSHRGEAHHHKSGASVHSRRMPTRKMQLIRMLKISLQFVNKLFCITTIRVHHGATPSPFATTVAVFARLDIARTSTVGSIYRSYSRRAGLGLGEEATGRDQSGGPGLPGHIEHIAVEHIAEIDESLVL